LPPLGRETKPFGDEKKKRRPLRPETEAPTSPMRPAKTPPAKGGGEIAYAVY